MGKEHGINGDYFVEVRDFYDALKTELQKQGIAVAGAVMTKHKDGTPETGMYATGVSVLYATDKPLLEITVTLNRTRIEESFGDYSFKHAVVRAVGEIEPGKLEKVLAGILNLQTKRANQPTK